MLDYAWSLAPEDEGSLLPQLQNLALSSRNPVKAGSIVTTSANGRQVQLPDSGATPGQATQLEIADAWQALYDLAVREYRWLKWCYTYGLDPFDALLNQTPQPEAPVADPATVTDADLYEWMHGSERFPDSTRNWPGCLIPVREIRSDFSMLRTSGGYQWT